jgi:hypothetical protein
MLTYAYVQTALLLALVPAVAEPKVNLEVVLHQVVVKVEERRELEDAVVQGGAGGMIETARVKIIERREWRELRTIVPIIPRSGRVSKEEEQRLHNSLTACFETTEVEEASTPLTVGLEMSIAPMPDKVEKFIGTLGKCLAPSLGRRFRIGSVDFKINTRDLGWHERVQDQKGHRRP